MERSPQLSSSQDTTWLRDATDNPLAQQFHEDGFAVVSTCLSRSTVDRFVTLTETARQQSHLDAAVSNSSGVYALRNLTDVIPEVIELFREATVTDLVTSILGADAFLVRSTLFDKTEGANWGVFWHQDLSIAVEGRHDVPGFHAWTQKAGVQCVQPPAELMAKILTIRLHLDDCFAQNGALKVLTGSHRHERLTTDRIELLAKTGGETVCEVPAGGAVLMSPLLLHASSPMEKPGHRRVIHLEFAAFELPAPLTWRYRIPCRA